MNIRAKEIDEEKKKSIRDMIQRALKCTSEPERCTIHREIIANKIYFNSEVLPLFQAFMRVQRADPNNTVIDYVTGKHPLSYKGN